MPRILFYAINGSGLGHIVRLTTIADEIERLCQAIGAKVDVQFLTTSDYSHIAKQYPVFKIPSKTSIKNSGGSARNFLASAKLIVSNVVASIRPDLLVMDTQPEGSFHEFLFIRDYAKCTALINRHKDGTISDAPVNQTHLPLYDRILVPHHQDSYREAVSKSDASSPLLENSTLQPKLRFTGPIVSFNDFDAWQPDRVRSYFNVTSDQKLIYVAAGGGGDVESENQINSLIDTLLSVTGALIVIGYGPLYSGEKRYGPRLIPLTEAGVNRYFRGFDAAFSAAGYNTYEELLAARVPTAFFAQQKGMDRQDLRIELGLQSGWHAALPDFQQDTITNLSKQLLQPQHPFPNLKKRPQPNGRTRAAFELLDLLGAQLGNVDRRRLAIATAVSINDAVSINEREPSQLQPLSIRLWTEWQQMRAPSWLDDANVSARQILCQLPSDQTTFQKGYGPFVKLASLLDHCSWPPNRIPALLQRLPVEFEDLSENIHAQIERLTSFKSIQVRSILLDLLELVRRESYWLALESIREFNDADRVRVSELRALKDSQTPPWTSEEFRNELDKLEFHDG